MNIIQLFDLLKIEKNHVAMFSDFDIIRIEKELNVERKINPEIDVNVANNLILALKNNKEVLVFIINNRALYNLFSNKNLPKSNFTLNQNELDDQVIRQFIEKYLADDLTLFLDKEIAQNKFGDVADLLSIKKYFPEDVLFRLEKKIHGKADFAVAKLNQMPLNLTDIEFVKNNHFYRLLNCFVSLDSDNKIRDLINPIVEKYNNNYSKEFLAAAMIAMFNYKAFDEDLHKVIVDNKNAMFGNITRNTGTSSQNIGESKSKTSWLSVGFLFFAIIKILLLISKCSDSGSSNNQVLNDQNQDIFQNINVYQEQMKLEKTTDFYAFLTNPESEKKSIVTLNTTIKTGQNPFNNLYTFQNLNYLKNEKISFENKTSFDIIVLMNNKIKIQGDFANRSYRSPKAAFFLKSNEKFQIDSDTINGLAYSFYFGKKLGLFEPQPNTVFKSKDSIPEYRFIQLARNADKLIEQELIFTHDVEIFEKNGAISWKQKIK